MAQKKNYRVGVKGQDQTIEFTVQELEEATGTVIVVTRFIEGDGSGANWKRQEIVGEYTYPLDAAGLQPTPSTEEGAFYWFVATDRNRGEPPNLRETIKYEVTYEELGGGGAIRARYTATGVSEGDRYNFTDEFLSDIENRFNTDWAPDATISRVNSAARNVTWQFNIAEQYKIDAFNYVERIMESPILKRRRYSINAQGYSALEASPTGIVEDVWANIQPYIVDDDAV